MEAGKVFKIGVIVIIIGVLLYLVVKVPGCMIDATKEYVVATVTGKDRITDTSGDSIESYYVIFTDVETFKNTDNWLIGKTRSSDVQGRILVGKKYEFEVYGWRSGWLSSYRNIISFHEVNSDQY